jgi:hypothetical protein
MPFYLSIPLALLLCVAWGGIIYVFALWFIDPEKQEAFSRIIPLYLKTKYSVTLYGIAGILYFIYSYLTWQEFHLSEFEFLVVSPMCVLIASQMVRFIASYRKEELEESYEEEMRQKEEHKYDDLKL